MITKDFHVHLHGVLDADDLWQLGKACYHTHTNRLQWYAEHYAKAWGRTPDFAAYWQKDEGPALLALDYQLKEAVSFQRFQACFNLIIALCPLTDDDFSIQERIIRKVATAGLHYFEARTIISPFFSPQQHENYLNGLCQLVQRLNAELAMHTSLVFSLDRRPELRDAHYRVLRDFCAARPELATVITGIDFAGWEEDFPPELNRQFIQRFFSDNQRGKKLELLYHVGESFSTLSLASALRWIFSLAQMGLSRLGHAIALGCNPELFLGNSVEENRREFDAHQLWFKREEASLRHLGYVPGHTANAVSIDQSAPGKVKITYTPEYIADLQALQRALALFIREKNIIIESCPTSNSRLAAGHNPLQFFVRNHIKVVLGTDDPGIFGTNWQQEADFAQLLSGEREIFIRQADLLENT